MRLSGNKTICIIMNDNLTNYDGGMLVALYEIARDLLSFFTCCIPLDISYLYSWTV